MTPIELRQVQITLNAPIGTLTEARRQRILEEFEDAFTPQPVPFQGAFALVNHAAREALFLTDTQLQYTAEGEVHFSPVRVEDLLGRVRDVLLLDDRFPLILQVIGHKDANGSAFERTVDAFTPLPPITMRQYFPGLRGLGLRITFEQTPYVCDLRIEPLFSDPAYFYIQFNAGSQQTVLSVAHLVEDVDDWINRLQGEMNSIITEMLGG
ncbi:MAG: hypothetical protein NZL85_00180 [Fimbriimonadales bacterium]|nr:hypothetical protein [Fimbriimonadales bacterium]